MVIAMRPSKGGRVENGKLLSRLEWPYKREMENNYDALDQSSINSEHPLPCKSHVEGLQELVYASYQFEVSQ